MPSILHIVLFKFKPDADAAAIDALFAQVETLRGIPFVKSIKHGENFTQRSKGYTHALVVEMAERAQVAEYAAHPLHLPVSEQAKVLCEDLLVLDVENASVGV